MTKKIYILGGGTNSFISNHLSLSAPAYGTTAIQLEEVFKNHPENKMDVELILTKMANPSIYTNPHAPDTPEDIEVIVDRLVADPDTRVIIFNVAMVDYKPTSLFSLERNSYDAYDPIEITDRFGKYAGRLNTSKLPEVCLELSVQDKIIQKIRKERKDILLVGFKTTCGATKEEQFNKGLKLCKEASANIVFVNDVDEDRITTLKSKITEKEKLESILKYQHDISINLLKLEKEILDLQNNGLVTPEESSYWYNTREEALDALVQMVLDRSHLHFTRSTVVDAETISWDSKLIPETFKTIFDFVRRAGAYKLGPTKSTVGHFGLSLGPNEFLTSKRKTDFNKIEEVGLVRVITDDPDNVFGYKHFFRPFDDRDVDHLKAAIVYICKYFDEEELREEWLASDPGYHQLVKAFPDLNFIDSYNGYNEAFNRLSNGNVYPDKVIAFGAKPSVGGQSQRSLFDAYPNLDCIVHFHCPLKPESRELLTTTKQFSYECGSVECSASNLTGFKEYKVSETHSIWAGHMDYHGPNIVFSKDIDPQLVIDFIDTYWDLSRKTDGLSKDNK